MFIKVAFNLPLKKVFTYLPPEKGECGVGMRVKAPFGRREVQGFVVEVAENDNVPMAFIELKDEFKDNPDLIDYIIEQCKLNIKDYERPKL